MRHDFAPVPAPENNSSSPKAPDCSNRNGRLRDPVEAPEYQKPVEIGPK